MRPAADSQIQPSLLSAPKFAVERPVLIVGGGAAVQEKLFDAVSSLSTTRPLIIDVNEQLQHVFPTGTFICGDATDKNFLSRIFPESSRAEYLVIIATHDHLEPLIALANLGFQRFIVEKPLVANSAQLAALNKQIEATSNLKVYPLEPYVQKAYPLCVASGRFAASDPRWQLVETSSGITIPDIGETLIDSYLGEIEGINTCIAEGGVFGITDLDKRKWLENDKERGGVLLDLGTHALMPLFYANVVDPAKISILSAALSALRPSRDSFRPAQSMEAETEANVNLAVRFGERVIPWHIHLSKLPTDGGLWNLHIRGTNGDLFMNLRTNGALTLSSNDGCMLQLRLKDSPNPSVLALANASHALEAESSEEISLAYSHMQSAIQLIDRVKDYPH